MSVGKIEREVFVCRRATQRPIDYPQGTDAIPLWFFMRDYEIPDGASAKMYLKNPSGETYYTSGLVEGNAIIFDMTEKMTKEAGRAKITVHITLGGMVLNSFAFPFHVASNTVEEDATEGEDEWPLYRGELTVVSKPWEEQIMETEGKRMGGNVTVLEIPFSAVSNGADGVTVTIG